jgi:DNA-binding transcriptional regulator/RsmH inhibitor MraZ
VVVAGVYDHIEIWHPETFDVEDAVSNRQYRDDEEVPGF